MSVSEGQKLGALTVLALCLFYYGFTLFDARQPVLESPLPWGRQNLESVAIEVRGSRPEGIYFMPKGVALDQISKVAGGESFPKSVPRNAESLRSQDRLISDGALLLISPTGEVTVDEISAARRLALGLRLDLNHSSEADLALVPGIGDRMAAQIMQLRLEKGEFRDLSDLTAVPGIKEKKLNSLKNYLMVMRTKKSAED